MNKLVKNSLSVMLVGSALTLATTAVADGDGKKDGAPAAAQADAAKAPAKEGGTVKNLQASFDGESNAHAKYLEFGKKADTEGYKSVGALFRAAARAEEIHAKAMAQALKGMGAEAKADVKQAEVKDTASNLEMAINGELKENEKLYPDFVKTAREEKASQAVRAFNFAMAAEKQHATLYAAAKENLGKLKDKDGTTYYVCPVCGATFTAEQWAALGKCPICFANAKTFEAIT